MIETFFLKNIRYFTKSLNILHVSTKNKGWGGGSFIYFSSQKYLLTLPLEFSFMWLRLSDYRGEEAGDTYSRPTSPSGTVRAGHTPSSQLTPYGKGPGENWGKSKGKIIVFLLIILVTGNRKRRRGLPPAPCMRVFLRGRPRGPRPGALAEPPGVGARVLSSVWPGAGSGATWRAWAGAPLLQASVRPVLPLLVLFILLPVGALGAEPLHLFRGRGHDPHAGPTREPSKRRFRQTGFGGTHLLVPRFSGLSHHSITC